MKHLRRSRKRKPRLYVGDLVVANEYAPGNYRARRGLVVKCMPVEKYEVRFDDGRTENPTLDSPCLDLLEL